MKNRMELSAVVLKYIAIVAMTIDHIAFMFVPNDTILYYVMRMCGRLTAPIMSFFISQGFIYTSSRKKYLLRLLFFAVISQPVYFMMIFSRPPESVFEYLTNLNVMFTLSLGLVVLIIVSNKKLNLSLKMILTGVCLAASDLCDWSFIVPVWILIFFYLKNDKKKMNVVFIGSSVVLLLLRYLPLYESFGQFSYQFGVLFALILLNFYNGNREQSCTQGKNKLIGKWLFYFYYPLHMALINLICILIRQC